MEAKGAGRSSISGEQIRKLLRNGWFKENRDKCVRKEHGHKMKKTIITVVGKDTVGIIARVCTYLADNKINILDISQTIVQGYFNMMMIVDTNQTQKDFGVIVSELDQLGESIGVIIKCQKEEIFDRMHRI